MESSELLLDAYSRIQQTAHHAAEGLSAEQLAHRPEKDANSIAWLVWHLTRVQDDHVSEIAGQEQAWLAEGWAERFGLPAEPRLTGYGHTSEQVGTFRPESPDLLLRYLDRVIERTNTYLGTVNSTELSRVIDRSYDPPVTVGVRLVSVINDNIQHAGQARYVRGIVERRASQPSG